MPAGTGEHVPDGFPVSIELHDVQGASHAVSQQTPWAQCPEGHSASFQHFPTPGTTQAPSTHAFPSGQGRSRVQCTHLPPLQISVAGHAMSVFDGAQTPAPSQVGCATVVWLEHVAGPQLVPAGVSVRHWPAPSQRPSAAQGLVDAEH